MINRYEDIMVWKYNTRNNHERIIRQKIKSKTNYQLFSQQD